MIKRFLLVFVFSITFVSLCTEVDANEVEGSDPTSYTEISEDKLTKWEYDFNTKTYAVPYERVILEYYDGRIVELENVGETDIFWSTETQQHSFGIEQSIEMYIEGELAVSKGIASASVKTGLRQGLSFSFNDTKTLAVGHSTEKTWTTAHIGSWEYVSVIEKGKLYTIDGSVDKYTREATSCEWYEFWNWEFWADCEKTEWHLDTNGSTGGSEKNHVEYIDSQPKKALLFNPYDRGYIRDDQIDPTESTSVTIPTSC